MRKLILRRGGLSYPGSPPGFNESHPAASTMVPGIGFSAIAVGDNTINLLTGQPFTPTAVTTKTLGFLGPAAGFLTAGSSGCAINGQKVFNLNAFTTGAIVQFSAVNTATFQTMVSMNNGGGQSPGMYVDSIGFLCFYTDTETSSNLALAANIPYFIAGSYLPGGVGNFVLLNLNTGTLVTASVAAGSATVVATTATQQVGQNIAGSNQATNGYIARAMWSNTFLSLPQLIAWAGNPWEFWHPAPIINIAEGAPSSAPTPFPFGVYGINVFP